MSSWDAGLMLAALAGLAHAMRRGRQRGIGTERMVMIGLLVILSGLLGGVIGGIIGAALRGVPAQQVIRLLVVDPFHHGIFQFGVTVLGMIPGGVIGILLASRFWRVPMLKLGDIFAPTILLMLTIFRVIGCFLAGCCYGVPTESAWSVVYPWLWYLMKSPFPVYTPVYPSPLIEAALALIGLAGVWWIERRPRFPGAIFWGVGISVALIRGVSDQFRFYDSSAIIATLGGINIYAHYLSALLPTLLVSLCGMAYAYTRRPSPAA